MAIYVRPGGNDAKSGENDTSEALQTLNVARTKYDYSNPDKRDIVFCADTVGGTANFSGTSGFRFLNNNQSLWQFGTSAAQRMSMRGRVGDTINFLATSSFWFQIKDALRYFTFANFTIIDSGMTGTPIDAPIKIFANDAGVDDQVGLIIDSVGIVNAHTDGMKLSPKMNGWQVTNCLFRDFGRVGSNNQGVYGAGLNGLLAGNVAYQNPANVAFLGTGLRFYTAGAGITAGYPESAGGVMTRNLVYDCQTGLAWSGNNNLIMNNYLVELTNIALDFLPQPGGSNDGQKVLNNSGQGIGASDHGFFLFGPGNPHDNVEIQNNILWGYTNPVNLNGGSATVNADNLTDSDPLFTNVSLNDLSIPTGSPAKNNGATRAEVTEDFVGTLRPQGAAYDQGAFEFVEAAAGGFSRDRVVNVGLLPPPRRYFFMGWR
ncbi:MAG: choice-of-anchor Q domain-containing protein [Nitrospirales bacterium]